jgi:hypothetical protein
MGETANVSLYTVIAEPASEGSRGETAITASKETVDADAEEREWLLTFGD